MESPEHKQAEELGSTYSEFMREKAWELDVGAETPSTGDSKTEPLDSPPPERQASRDTSDSEPQPSTALSPLRILEAMLFVGSVPLSEQLACETIRGHSGPMFHEAMDTLNRGYREQGRPYLIEEGDDGYKLSLRPGYQFLVNKLYGGVKDAKLSQAVVDVLAIVAYRQPVGKQEVDSVRGHESGAQLRQLVRRGLIAIASRAESGGREVLYGTTDRFLMLFDLKNLDDLPQTEDLQRL